MIGDPPIIWDLQSTWVRLVRRIFYVPAFFIFALMGLGLALVLFTFAWCADALHAQVLRGRSWFLSRTRATAAFMVYLMAESVGVGTALLLGLLTLGGILVGRNRWVSLNAALQRLWTRGLFLSAGSPRVW